MMTDEDTYLQVEFFSRQPEITSIPSAPLAVPGGSSVEQLTLLLSRLLENEADGDGKTEDVVYDFLIQGVLLRVTLDEFVEEHQLSTESVLRIECVLREPAPSPDLDLPHSDWIAAVVATSSVILSGSYDSTVSLWSRKDGAKLAQNSQLHEGAVKCLAVLSENKSADEQFRFVSGSQDQTLRLWRAEGGDKRNKLVCERILKGHERSVECVCVNGDATRIVSGSFDRFIKVWNAEAVEKPDEPEQEKAKKRKTPEQKAITQTPMVTLSGHKDAVTGVCWSVSQRAEVVTVSWDHTIAVWDLELAGQKATLTGNKAFTSVSLSPESELIITGSTDKHARLWDSRSKEGSMVKSTFTSHNGWITGVDWSKTRANLFVTSSFDGLVKMWDTRSPKAPLYDLSGHEDRVLCCDWSESAVIVSGSADATVKTFTCCT